MAAATTWQDFPCALGTDQYYDIRYWNGRQAQRVEYTGSTGFVKNGQYISATLVIAVRPHQLLIS